MRGSLNLILESHHPQTQEWDIYHAYEKNSDTSSRFVFPAETIKRWLGGQHQQTWPEE